MRNNWNIQNGFTVFGSDGNKIGTVKDCSDTYCHIDTGFLGLGPDYYVPYDSIQNVRNNEVILNVTGDRVGEMGWDEMPTDQTVGAGGRSDWTGPMPREGGYVGDRTEGFSDERSDVTRSDVGSDMGTDRSGFRGSDYGTDRTGEFGDTGRRSMPLREEELRARRTTEKAGEVNIGKDVVEEQRSVDVPVSHEEVVVHQRDVDRPSDQPIGSGESIHVPVSEERVDVGKESHVYGEVDVEKRRVTENRQFNETLKREVPKVKKSGDVGEHVTDESTDELTDDERRRREKRNL